MALAACMGAPAVLGPLGLHALVHRTSPTTLNQLEASDAVGILVAAPLAMAGAVLTLRRHPAGPVLGVRVSAFALYAYTQVVVGQAYLRLPANVERFFPPFLAVVVLAEAGAVLGWRAVPASLPRPSARLERVAAGVLALVGVFLVLAQHLPSMLTAWRDRAGLPEYASSPTPFWRSRTAERGSGGG